MDLLPTLGIGIVVLIFAIIIYLIFDFAISQLGKNTDEEAANDIDVHATFSTKHVSVLAAP
jgi:Tfp pilus assembly protein PilO